MSCFDFAIAEDGRTVVVSGAGCCPPVTTFALPGGLTLDDDAVTRIEARDFGTLLVEGDGWQAEVAVPPEVAEWLLNETVKDAWTRGAGE